MSLSDYGWERYVGTGPGRGGSFAAGEEPGRILMSGAAPVRVGTESGELLATLAGRLRHEACAASELPAVGDWVALRRVDAASGRIERVLPRRSALTRREAGRRGAEQVVAANIDRVLVVMGLDGDYNPRRLERYLVMVRASGALPAILLTKSDLCPEWENRLAETRAIAPEVPAFCVNTLAEGSAGAVLPLMEDGASIALIGSSGAGKSTLVNRLLGSGVQRTAEVREADSRGRHTTTRREIFRLPQGALLIDNPGIREVGPSGGAASTEAAFDDIAALAGGCRFGDCRHEAEPGCAVLAAVECGAIDPARLRGFHTVLKEQAYLALKQDGRVRQEQQRRWRIAHKELRRFEKERRR